MTAKDRPPEKSDKDERAPNVVKGPWDLPVEKPRRAPFFKSLGAGRAPIINNWGGLVAVILLIFVAPPLVGWLSRVMIGLLHGR